MSARKRIVLVSIGGVILIAATTYSLFSFLYQVQSTGDVTLRSGDKRYVLSVAITPAQQQKGLGNRASLPKNQGMLFSFEQPVVQCFWMKDMHFPLDMIWVSSSQRVEYLKADVLPSTYPHTICPDVQAKYVIELNAGQAQEARIHTGETLDF